MLSEEQQQIEENLLSWVDKNVYKRKYYQNRTTYNQPPYITVGGYAGTGKTFLISHFRKKLKNQTRLLNVAFVTFTGKASTVLKEKLDEHNASFSSDFCGTIHKLIYIPRLWFDPKLNRKVVIGWEPIEEIPYDLIIIDEASMVNKTLWQDLLKYNVPIILVGDHGQLPPIDDNFNLIQNPTFKLSKIHRQAESSPLIALSKFVRENGYIKNNNIFSNEIFKLDWRLKECQKIWENVEIDSDLIILCGFNATRVNINNLVREKLDFTDKIPYPTERIVCLKNNYETKIMNGQISTVLWMMPAAPNFYRLTAQLDNSDLSYESLVSSSCFGKPQYDEAFELFGDKKIKDVLKDVGFSTFDLFDYGYCISVHKSQGSEWDRVVLFEQRSKYWDDDYYRRWLYTAITRAKKKLFVISNFYG